MEKRFGDDAFYVHLIRDRDATANSFNQRWFLENSIIHHYKSGVLMGGMGRLNNAEDALVYCYDYFDKVNEAIECFLKNKAKKITIRTEYMEVDFPVFWQMLGAKGNLNKALSALAIRHNTNGNKALEVNSLHKARRFFSRLLNKIFKSR